MEIKKDNLRALLVFSYRKCFVDNDHIHYIVKVIYRNKDVLKSSDIECFKDEFQYQGLLKEPYYNDIFMKSFEKWLNFYSPIMKDDNNEETTEISVGDFNEIINLAMKYAIGRHTYAPSLVTDIIKNHKENIYLVTYKSMIDYIDEWLEHYEKVKIEDDTLSRLFYSSVEETKGIKNILLECLELNKNDKFKDIKQD
ncbi:MAG: hypothetical protein ACQESN_08700 [Thermotogota bacterium]